jgi:hypothetical protein
MQLDLRVGQMLQQLMVEVDMSDFINISCVHVVSMTTTSFGCVQVSMGVIYILQVMLLTRLLIPHIIFVARMQ